MSRRSVSIMLAPSGMETVRLVGGKVVSADFVPLEKKDWAATWTRGLAPLDQSLASALKRLHIRHGTPVQVFYHSPDAVSEVLSLPVTAAEAAPAARLALADVVRFNIGSNPVSLTVLKSERNASPLTHVLAAADQEEHVSALVGWLRKAGCEVGQICPARAAILATVVKTASAANGALGVFLHMGQHTTAMVGMRRDEVFFVRCLDFGYELLIDAMARGMSVEGEVDAARTANAALELFERGLPLATDDTGPVRGLRNTLPLLQPVLQRYVVETKQTLRFGLNDTNGESPRLVITGPGAAIPGIAKVLGEHAQIDVDVDAQASMFSPAAPGHASGDLVRCALQTPARVSLLPRHVRERRDYRRVQKALVCGGLLAGAFVSLDATKVAGDLKAVRAGLAGTAVEVAAIEERRETDLLIAEMEETTANAKRLLAEAAGGRTSHAGLLCELSRLGSDTVRITEVRGQSASLASVDGIAFLDSSDEDALRTYMDVLDRSPVIGAVSLGSTRLTRVEGRAAKRFTLEISLATLPVFYAAKEIE